MLRLGIPEKHGWRVATLSLLAGTLPNYRLICFRWEFLDCSHVFTFPACKLLDLDALGI